MVDGFELVLVLVVVIGVVVTVARRVHAPWPVLLVLTGLGLTRFSQFGHVDITPDLVLTVFLPPLLFGAAWYTPVQDVRRYRRAIALLSVGLVLFTTFVVAYTADLLIPGLPLAAAFALGAIVAPPDAISAIAVLRPLAVPRRMLAILEGESLVNDATALTAFSVSVAAATTGAFEPEQAVLDFLWALGVGVTVGSVVAVVSGWVWSRLSDPPVEVSLSLVIPYLAYLPAEQLHGSGVIAAVTAGLLLGYRQARILTSDARVVGASVWSWVTYTLNGFAFLVIGLELPTVLGAVEGRPTGDLLLWATAVSIAVVVVRLVWVVPATHWPRLISGVGSHPGRVPTRGALIVGWAGMRGAVSLAAALALPFGFPERDLLIFLAFCVILVTLVGQGLTLGPLIRFLGIGPGDEVAREEEEARRTSTRAALGELERLRGEWPGHLPLIDRLGEQFQHRMRYLAEDGEPSAVEQERLEHRAILGSVIRVEREAVAEMRGRGQIDDGVLRSIERELDLEELRLSAET